MRLPRSYQRLLVAGFCSLTGDGFRMVALPLLAASLSPTAGAVSLVATATVLPWLVLAVPAGAIVDRLPAIRVIQLAHLFRCAVSAVLAAAVAFDGISIAALCVVGFLLTSAETFADGGAQTALVGMVDRRHLERANSRFFMVETVALDLVGPLAAGATFGVARWLPFLLSAALFLSSTAVLTGLAEPTSPEPDASTRPRQPPPQGIWRDIRVGVGRLFADPVLRTLVLTVAVMAAATAAQDGVLVVFATTQLHLSAALFPTLLAAYSLGTLLAGWLTGRFVRDRRTGPVMIASVVGVGASMTVMGLLADRWSAWICYGVMGLAGGTWNVLSAARRQRRTPAEMVGRVSSAFRLVAWGSLPIGTALGGALGTAGSVPWVFVVSGAAVLVLAAVMFRPLLRSEDRTRPPAQTTVPGTP